MELGKLSELSSTGEMAFEACISEVRIDLHSHTIFEGD